MLVKIYSVGVWNARPVGVGLNVILLKFTPLEFETFKNANNEIYAYVKIYSVGVWNYVFFSDVMARHLLKFTPLEFETMFSM